MAPRPAGCHDPRSSSAWLGQICLVSLPRAVSRAHAREGSHCAWRWQESRGSVCAFGMPATPEKAVVRAAYDIGSGLSKVQVAEVEPRARTILRVLHAEQRQCLMREAMALRGDGSIGAEALAECAQILREMKARAEALGAAEHAAIATAVFREASDGQGFLDATVNGELGLRASVVSQRVEGEIGFLTAVAAASDAGVGCGERGVVAWDSGGGSFQVSALGGTGLDVWGVHLGSASATALMVEAVQGRSFAEEQSPNPCSIDDCLALAERMRADIGPAPGWLLDRLAARGDPVTVIAIGGKTGAFGNSAQACGKAMWTAGELWAAIECLAGSTDGDLQAAGFTTVRMILPKLVLVHTVMSIVGMESARHLPSAGGCAGMLLCDSLWAFSPARSSH
uniref:Ppx/GppA phosphatase N-terminal domain-containing protein n=1 Tax=Alexandrium monilatum TaxID=311494 RepID=A0A7S4QAX1_9DINO